MSEFFTRHFLDHNEYDSDRMHINHYYDQFSHCSHEERMRHTAHCGRETLDTGKRISVLYRLRENAYRLLYGVIAEMTGQAVGVRFGGYATIHWIPIKAIIITRGPRAAVHVVLAESFRFENEPRYYPEDRQKDTASDDPKFHFDMIIDV